MTTAVLPCTLDRIDRSAKAVGPVPGQERPGGRIR